MEFENCTHKHIVTENYLNPCSVAGCDLNKGIHYECGTQQRDVCEDCGAIVWDSAIDD